MERRKYRIMLNDGWVTEGNGWTETTGICSTRSNPHADKLVTCYLFVTKMKLNSRNMSPAIGHQKQSGKGLTDENPHQDIPVLRDGT